MSFREQMSQMRREYRKEADRLDQKIDHLVDKVDTGFGVVQERLGKVETAVARAEESVRVVQLQLQATRDEVAATNEAFGLVRGDLQETNRTLKGRVRLVEDRFGKMLELVATTMESAPTIDRIERIEERLLALETRNDPAA